MAQDPKSGVSSGDTSANLGVSRGLYKLSDNVSEFHEMAAALGSAGIGYGVAARALAGDRAMIEQASEGLAKKYPGWNSGSVVGVSREEINGLRWLADRFGKTKVQQVKEKPGWLDRLKNLFQ